MSNNFQLNNYQFKVDMKHARQYYKATEMKTALIFGLSLISFLLFLFLTQQVLISKAAALETDTDEATQSSQKGVEYTFAYPGVLPDNPLYFFKAARDKLVSILISSPVKKAEFNLLTSDKRIYAAKILADRSKPDLALTTLSKSNNYMDEAIKAIRQPQAKKENNFDTILHNLSVSMVKHKEFISIIEKRVPKNLLPRLKAEEKRLNNFIKSVNQLVSKQ